MNRDDVVTFGLALVAAIITFYIVGTWSDKSGLPMYVLAFVVFGALIFVRSFLRAAS